LERWLWELNYQHNHAYNATFLPPGLFDSLG